MAVARAIGDEVHCPAFPGFGYRWRGLARRGGEPTPAFHERKPFLPVDPVDTLVVDAHPITTQEPAEGAVTSPRALRCKCTQPRDDFFLALSATSVSLCGPRNAERPARAPLAQTEGCLHIAN